MFNESDRIFIKKDKIGDFLNIREKYGFESDYDSYVYKKHLSDREENLYILITVSLSNFEVYVELNVPRSYWIEFGVDTFEPLFELYKEGYIEIRKG